MSDEKILEILWRDGYHAAAKRMTVLMKEEMLLENFTHQIDVELTNALDFMAVLDR